MLTIDPAAGAADLGEDTTPPQSTGACRAVIRAALTGYAVTGDSVELERGLAAARGLLTADRAAGSEAARERRPPPRHELCARVDALPELGELLEVAAAATGRAVAQGTTGLWHTLGLHGTPPAWGEAEHEAARMVLACACATPGVAAPDWLAASLRRLSAGQIAARLVDELSRGEAVWERALGSGYGSLRHRCAPRTLLSSRGLADLLRGDERCAAAVTRRLERWVIAGAATTTLAAELEAAIVHARTPARIA